MSDNNLKKWKAYVEDSSIARTKTSYTGIGADFHPDYTKDRLIVHTDTKLSILKLSRKNQDIYKNYIDIISHDFIMIGHKNGYSIFMKRTKYSPEKLETYRHLKRYNHLIYTLTEPELKKRSSSLPKRLLVLFSHMNGGGGYDSNNAIERMFVQFFNDIQRSLVKNVYILRLADLNLSHGSYFVNTDNFPEYENCIQELINNVRSDLDIASDDVVLYGGSKGGTGALIHGALGDYKVVAGDPIINASKYNQNKDWHFIKNFREADLTNKIFEYSKNNKNRKFIFASNKQNFNYKASMGLSNKLHGLVHIVDLSNDIMVKTHPHITSQSVPEQITLINLLLDGEKILGKSLGVSVNKISLD